MHETGTRYGAVVFVQNDVVRLDWYFSRVVRQPTAWEHLGEGGGCLKNAYYGSCFICSKSRYFRRHPRICFLNSCYISASLLRSETHNIYP